MGLKMLSQYFKARGIRMSDIDGFIRIFTESGEVITVNAEKSILWANTSEYWFIEIADDGNTNFIYVPDRIRKVSFKLKEEIADLTRKLQDRLESN